MTRHTLHRWKTLLITENGVGLWTEVVGEDEDAAIENAEHMSGLEVVMITRIPSKRLTLSERIAA